MRLAAVLLSVLALATAAGCGEDDADSGAFLSCREFHSLARDQADGLASDADTRTRVAEIHSDARMSEEPGIASWGRAMHDAAQTGDDAALAEAVNAFGRACEDAGEGSS